jgi:hypothetical protein
MHDPEPLVLRRHEKPEGQGVAAVVQLTGTQKPLAKRRDVVCVSWICRWQKYPSEALQSVLVVQPW